MRVIYRNAQYTINVLNKERNCILYNNELVCKYDNTYDGIRLMTSDLIEFLIEDNLSTKANSKQLRTEIQKIVKQFNEVMREEKEKYFTLEY